MVFLALEGSVFAVRARLRLLGQTLEYVWQGIQNVLMEVGVVVLGQFIPSPRFVMMDSTTIVMEQPIQFKIANHVPISPARRERPAIHKPVSVFLSVSLFAIFVNADQMAVEVLVVTVIQINTATERGSASMAAEMFARKDSVNASALLMRPVR